MKKKFQVFISSTYTDLIEERQSAVEAVLSSGHIPAGMELFKAGDESQKETIKKWINESDVYLLILGGRYGSIEPVSGKSYTHWEYDYAGEVGIERFAIVINDRALDEKIKKNGKSVIEIENSDKYEEFKQMVLSKTSEFFEDCKDIKLTILRKMADFGLRKDLDGWVSAKDIDSSETLINEISRLTKENRELKDKLNTLSKKLTKTNQSGQKIIFNILVRTNRLLKVYGAVEQDELVWYENNDEEEDKKEVILPATRAEFIPYFVMDKEENIFEVLIVGICSLKMSFNDALAEIRVMLSEHQDIEHDMPIKFIVVIQGNKTAEVKKAQAFFDRALESSVKEKKELYSIDIWDEERMIELENEHVLII